MGANASTAVPLYASGQVLDAARLNLTNSGVPVFSGTATRDAAFGGSGEKVLAEGQLCYLEDANVVQYYDGASFATVGPATVTAPGLVLIKTQTIGSAVSSVEVTGAFSATYDNYRVIVSNTDGSVGGANISMVLGASTTTYSSAGRIFYTDNNSGSFNRVTTSSWYVGLIGSVNQGNFVMDILLPNLAQYTTFTSSGFNANDFAIAGGEHATATAYTAFTLGLTSGTFTGGTIKVYGYANS
jgi:hypothetical protein